MKVKFIGNYARMGPVQPSTALSAEKNDLVEVSGGQVIAATDSAATGLAVLLDKYPDAEYEPTAASKTQVGLGRLGESCEVEVPFTNSSTIETLAQADFGGGPFAYDLTLDKIDLSDTVSGCFIPLRVAYGTSVGDRSGNIIGVFADATTFGGS